MMHPHHQWRIEANRSTGHPSLLLNGVPFIGCRGVDVHVEGYHSATMVLELAPTAVMLLTNPDLQLVIGGRRFRVIEEL